MPHDDARAEARARYGETLLHATSRIVGSVHDDGPDQVRDAIDHALTIEQPPGEDPVVWLVTALAAQVNPEATPSERLGWINAGPIVRLRDEQLDRARLDWMLGIDNTTEPLVIPDYEAMTLRAIEGMCPLDDLPEQCQIVAVETLRRRGLSVSAAAARLQTSGKTIQRVRAKHRAQHGIPDPAPAIAPPRGPAPVVDARTRDEEAAEVLAVVEGRAPMSGLPIGLRMRAMTEKTRRVEAGAA